MLTKNVYILYPAGYSGSYVNWAISTSDTDMHKHTVSDPINKINSTSHGGSGTSHLHVRVPTHQGYPQHINWVLYNKPTDYKIYIMNFESGVERYIVNLMQQDPEGVCIVIHDNNDYLIRDYGTINCITKWPSYIAATLSRAGKTAKFDPFSCSDSLEFRNWVVKNYNFFHTSSPINFNLLEQLVDNFLAWFNVRNLHQPHEVNTDTYFLPTKDFENKVYQFSCLDVASENFVDIMQHILDTSGISSNYNTEHLKEFHRQYIDAQQNLQWFDSFKEWSVTGKIDEYILSHSGIQAHLIKHIFALSNKHFLSQAQQDSWQAFYARVRGSDWPSVVPDQHEFYLLPDCIQKEIKDFNFEFAVTDTPIQKIVELDWENSSLEKINEVYQEHRTVGRETQCTRLQSEKTVGLNPTPSSN